MSDPIVVNVLPAAAPIEVAVVEQVVVDGDGAALPAGGTTGQVLTKASGDDGDADWEDPTGGGGTSAWGDLTGTLADQTDLQAALELKADTADLGTAAVADAGDFDAAGAATTAQSNAEAYADGLAANYDAAGDATAAQTAAEAHADTGDASEAAARDAAIETAITDIGLGTAATKDVGTGAGTVAAGDDARLSDTRTPTDGSVANAKLANMAQATVKGRAVGAGTGVPVDLTATQLAALADAGIRSTTFAINNFNFQLASGVWTPVPLVNNEVDTDAMHSVSSIKSSQIAAGSNAVSVASATSLAVSDGTKFKVGGGTCAVQLNTGLWVQFSYTGVSGNTLTGVAVLFTGTGTLHTLDFIIDAVTTIAAGSNGASLPQGTINVVDASAFPTSGAVCIVVGSGVQVVKHTGKGSTTLTGGTLGAGSLATGQTVIPACVDFIANTKPGVYVATGTVTFPSGISAGKLGVRLINFDNFFNLPVGTNEIWLPASATGATTTVCVTGQPLITTPHCRMEVFQSTGSTITISPDQIQAPSLGVAFATVTS